MKVLVLFALIFTVVCAFPANDIVESHENSEVQEVPSPITDVELGDGEQASNNSDRSKRWSK